MDNKNLVTVREIEIIQLIEKDYSNLQIAAVLTITVRTVETHRKNIYKKTNCHNVLSLVKWAYLHQLIPVSHTVQRVLYNL